MKKLLLVVLVAMMFFTACVTNVVPKDHPRKAGVGWFTTWDYTPLLVIKSANGERLAPSIVYKWRGDDPIGCYIQYTIYDENYKKIAVEYTDVQNSSLVGYGLILLELKAKKLVKQDIHTDHELRLNFTDDLAFGFTTYGHRNSLPYVCRGDEVLMSDISWEDLQLLKDILLQFKLK